MIETTISKPIRKILADLTGERVSANGQRISGVLSTDFGNGLNGKSDVEGESALGIRSIRSGNPLTATSPLHSLRKKHMTGKLIKTPYDEITYKIIGCAMAAHRKRGPVYREDTYQRDLEVHFTENRLAYVVQKNIEVYDSKNGDVLVGYYIPDFIVEEKVVVEIKALSGLDNSHIAQVITYLAVTGCPVGLLLNFGARSLQKRRIFPPKNVAEHTVNRQWLFVPDWLKAEQRGK